MSPHHSGRLPPPRLNREHPSFSAALLNAIYQSLDGDVRTPTDPLRASVSQAERPPPPPRRHRPSPTLSPSVSSVRSPRLQKPPRSCRVRPDPQPSILLPPPPLPQESTWDSAENRRNRRKKTKSASFACLLNALLCNRESAESVEPTTARALAAVTAEPESASSILSSRASRRESAATGGFLTPGRRAVRFSPVAFVVDEEHGREAGSARLRDADMEAAAAAQESAAEAERRVEELLRALGVAEEKERAKESSEPSSDLFELDSLTALDDTELPRPRAAAGVGLHDRGRAFCEKVV